MVKDGQMQLSMQKDGQRRVQINKESQVRSLTVDILLKLIRFMDINDPRFENMKKNELVESVCVLFQIPTTDSLSICNDDTMKIIDYQIGIIEEESITNLLIEYIETNQTNMIVVSDIIELCLEKSIDLINYIQLLWMKLIDNFSVNKNNDLEYKKEYEMIARSDEVIKAQKELQNDIELILNEYNKNNDKAIKHKGFWFAFNLSLFRFFNYCAKIYVISTYIDIPNNELTEMTEQRKCSIYRYFGSSCHSLHKTYKANNYSAATSLILTSIVDKCLLSYNNHVDEDEKSNHNGNDDDHKEYLKVPLRMRLQNRGFLKIISPEFYDNVAVKIYTAITRNIQHVFAYYDPKKIKQIESQILNDKAIYTTFDKHIGPEFEQNQKERVLKDLVHKVTSRIVLSLIKRNKINDGHVGQFRTGIKAIHAQKQHD